MYAIIMNAPKIFGPPHRLSGLENLQHGLTQTRPIPARPTPSSACPKHNLGGPRLTQAGPTSDPRTSLAVPGSILAPRTSMAIPRTLKSLARKKNYYRRIHTPSHHRSPTLTDAHPPHHPPLVMQVGGRTCVPATATVRPGVPNMAPGRRPTPCLWAAAALQHKWTGNPSTSALDSSGVCLIPLVPLDLPSHE